MSYGLATCAAVSTPRLIGASDLPKAQMLRRSIALSSLKQESSLSRVQQTNKHQKAVTRYQEGSSSASYTGTTEHNRQVQAVSRPLLHGGVLVVYGDPLACWPSQAGLLLQSAVLFMVQLLQLSSASLLTHLHTAPSSNALNSRKQDTHTQTHTLTQHHQAVPQ